MNAAAVGLVALLALSAFLSARGAPPPLAPARRLRASLGPQALLSARGAPPPLALARRLPPSLGPQALALAPDAFWCPMHPNVRAAAPDRCPLCSMTLVRVPPPVFGHYRLDVAQVPRTGRPGIRALRLDIGHPQTGDRVTALTETHERLLHLFIVGRDLSYFAHVHPEPSEGGFEAAVDLEPGAYVVIADFIPAGGAPQMIQRAIVTTGHTASPFAPTRLILDTSDKIVGGLRVSLTADVRPRKPSALRFTFRNATGDPVTDLEPYLGATGHLLVVNADVTEAIHAHPEGNEIGGGPDVIFAPVLPAAGVYKMWMQFQRSGTVFTVPFAVAVAGAE